jgi:hypothetical protein
MAIRKVNAITRPGCAEAQDGQLSASGIRASAAPEGEHKGVRQRNTFGAERRLCPSCGRVGWTVQYALNVRFWLVWQVARSSWQEQNVSAPPRSGTGPP